MKFPKTNKQIKKKKKPTGIKGIKLETDINKLLNILQKKIWKIKRWYCKYITTCRRWFS